MRRSRSHCRNAGFTLVELLVAMTVMALLALVSWRGLEGMSQATTQNRQRADAVLTLQTALAQWTADLDAVMPLAQTRPVDWDGRVLRLTRRGGDPATPAIQVVAWTLQADAAGRTRWRRWQSPLFTTQSGWTSAWQQAATWAEQGATNASGPDVALMPADSWQLAWYRDNVWQPAGDLGAAVANDGSGVLGTIPMGIRLVLTLPPGDGLSGVLTRDWMQPSAGQARS